MSFNSTLIANLSDSNDKSYEAELARRHAEVEALLWQQEEKECLKRQARKEAKMAEWKRLEEEARKKQVSQTSFGHISINSPSILTVSMAMESPWKDLSIGTSHASKKSVLAKILGRSTSNHHGIVY